MKSRRKSNDISLVIDERITRVLERIASALETMTTRMKKLEAKQRNDHQKIMALSNALRNMQSLEPASKEREKCPHGYNDAAQCGECAIERN